MWLKHMILTLSLVTTVMAYGNLYNSFSDMGINDDVRVVEIVEEPGEKEKKKEIQEFDIHGIILKEGIASEKVLKLKRFLIEIGYPQLNEDYYFDKNTVEVVMNYQEKNGLTPDGAVGVNTYKVINQDMGLNEISIDGVEIVFTSSIPDGEWIIINKDNNTLYYLKGDNLINKYHVATGKLPEYTPQGKFTIVTKYINPAWGGAGRYKSVKGGAPNNPLGERWMGLSIKGGGVYGIHGNSDSESIGRFISLGCVRMFNEDVEYLYELINLGTPVWIGGETELGKHGVFFSFPYNTKEYISKF